jgi:ergothioneine biosynthesis protein EgtB
MSTATQAGNITAQGLLAQIERAWERSDAIFALLGDAAWCERGIPLRHPPIFYLGHLPAFAWNQLGRGLLDRPALHAEYDVLFERGIDPPCDGDDAPVQPWPPLHEVIAYRGAARAAVRSAIERLPDGPLERAAQQVLHVILEHELEHHETLLYIIQQLDHALMRPCGSLAIDVVQPPPATLVPIPAGPVTLGAQEGAIDFGWDNEFPRQVVELPAFAIESRPVTNAEFAAFLDDGGYDDPRWWSQDDQAWLARQQRQGPVSWTGGPGHWHVRTLFEDLPLSRAGALPVQASQIEARAYLAWAGKSLPTEAELQRAAFGTADGSMRQAPWGSAAPTAERGSFDFHRWHALPVGQSRPGDSAFGVSELVGNGWEWTATPFAGLPGYRPNIPTYPGYSADFFDGRHFIVFGASWATDARLLRPSFRNWYQARYGYAFTSFRGVVRGA